MFIKIGDLKLLKIQVTKGEEIIYEGMVEDAPEDLKETNYQSATFESGFVAIKI